MTGREIERALLQAINNDDNISLFGYHFAIDLLTCQVGIYYSYDSHDLIILSLGMFLHLFSSCYMSYGGILHEACLSFFTHIPLLLCGKTVKVLLR
jgi:L-aspartate oxidase